MELDELKRLWGEEARRIEGRNALPAEELAARLRSSLRMSYRAVRRKLLVELAGIGFIYAFILILVAVLGVSLKSFQIALLALSAVFSLAIGFRFGRFLRRANRPDPAENFVSFLAKTDQEMRRTVAFYRINAYSFSALISLVFIADPSFRALPLALSAGTFLFIAVFALLIGPYLRAMYGSEIRSLARQRRDLEGDGEGGPDSDE